MFDNPSRLRPLNQILVEARTPDLAQMFETSMVGTGLGLSVSDMTVTLDALPTNLMDTPDCWVLVDMSQQQPDKLENVQLGGHITSKFKEWFVQNHLVPPRVINTDVMWAQPSRQRLAS